MLRKRAILNATDFYIGEQLRLARIAKGLTMQQLGSLVVPSISYQQLQKYECGKNRLAAARLFELSAALQTPIIHFFPVADANRAEHVGPIAQEIRFLRLWRKMSPESREVVEKLLEILLNP